MSQDLELALEPLFAFVQDLKLALGPLFAAVQELRLALEFPFAPFAVGRWLWLEP